MQTKGNGLRALPALMLGALFFMLAMGLALLSGSIYRGVVDAGDETAVQRTALSYVVNQVRRSDHAGGIAYGTFGGSDALFLRDNGYVTIIYVHEGQLCELYMEQESDLGPADGMMITALDAFTITAQNGVLDFVITGASGKQYAASIAPRSGIQEEKA